MLVRQSCLEESPPLSRVNGGNGARARGRMRYRHGSRSQGRLGMDVLCVFAREMLSVHSLLNPLYSFVYFSDNLEC
jgi:hypothetical protein